MKESTTRSVLMQPFRGRDKNFYTPQHQENRAFETKMVEHIHLLLPKKYREKTSLPPKHQTPRGPKARDQTEQEIVPATQSHAGLCLTPGCLQRGWWRMWRLPWWPAASQPNLKPTVSFVADTNPGDELHLQEERAQTRVEAFSAEIVTEPPAATEPC